MGKIYKRGATWWAAYTTARGEHLRRSLHTYDREVARERLRAAELSPSGDAANETLGGILGAYFARAQISKATRSSYEGKARHLVRVIGAQTPLDRITRREVDAFRDLRLSEGAVAHTVHKELVVLRQALKLASADGLFSGDARNIVASMSPKYVPVDRWITEQQARAMLDFLPVHRHAWFALACWGGLRFSEVEKLRWNDVSFSSRLIHVRGTKTKKSDRMVPISPALESLLPKQHDAGLVVSRWTGVHKALCVAYQRVLGIAPHRGGRAKGGAYNRRPATKLPRLSPNDLRRTCCTWLLLAKVEPMVVARILGHASTTMVYRVYGQISTGQIAAAGAALPTLACTTGVRDTNNSSPLGEHLDSTKNIATT